MYLELYKNELKRLIKEMFQSHKSTNDNLSLDSTYERLVTGEIQETTTHYSLRAKDILSIDDFITNQLK